MRHSKSLAVATAIGGVVLGAVVSVGAQTPLVQPQVQSGAQSGGTTQAQDRQRPPRAPDARPEGGPGGPRPGGPGRGGHGGPHGAIRSESVFAEPDGTIRTVRSDGGELKAIDGSKLTVHEQDGTDVTATVDDSTTYGRDGQQAKLADLKVGDHVNVMREKTGGGSFTTKHVRAISAERWAEMQQQRAARATPPPAASSTSV